MEQSFGPISICGWICVGALAILIIVFIIGWLVKTFGPTVVINYEDEEEKDEKQQS